MKTGPLSNYIFLAFLSLTHLLSCGQDLSQRKINQSESSFSGLACSCSNENSPVCAYNGFQYVTVLNGCIAQCNNLQYSVGACSQQATGQQTTCNASSGPVCGKTAGGAFQTYADECKAQSSGATVVNGNSCL